MSNMQRNAVEINGRVAMIHPTLPGTFSINDGTDGSFYSNITVPFDKLCWGRTRFSGYSEMVTGNDHYKKAIGLYDDNFLHQGNVGWGLQSGIKDYSYPVNVHGEDGVKIGKKLSEIGTIQQTGSTSITSISRNLIAEWHDPYPVLPTNPNATQITNWTAALAAWPRVFYTLKLVQVGSNYSFTELDKQLLSIGDTLHYFSLLRINLNVATKVSVSTTHGKIASAVMMSNPYDPDSVLTIDPQSSAIPYTCLLLVDFAYDFTNSSNPKIDSISIVNHSHVGNNLDKTLRNYASIPGSSPTPGGFGILDIGGSGDGNNRFSIIFRQDLRTGLYDLPDFYLPTPIRDSDPSTIQSFNVFLSDSDLRVYAKTNSANKLWKFVTDQWVQDSWDATSQGLIDGSKLPRVAVDGDQVNPTISVSRITTNEFLPIIAKNPSSEYVTVGAIAKQIDSINNYVVVSAGATSIQFHKVVNNTGVLYNGTDAGINSDVALGIFSCSGNGVECISAVSSNVICSLIGSGSFRGVLSKSLTVNTIAGVVDNYFTLSNPSTDIVVLDDTTYTVETLTPLAVTISRIYAVADENSINHWYMDVLYPTGITLRTSDITIWKDSVSDASKINILSLSTKDQIATMELDFQGVMQSVTKASPVLTFTLLLAGHDEYKPYGAMYNTSITTDFPDFTGLSFVVGGVSYPISSGVVYAPTVIHCSSETFEQPVYIKMTGSVGDLVSAKITYDSDTSIWGSETDQSEVSKKVAEYSLNDISTLDSIGVPFYLKSLHSTYKNGAYIRGQRDTTEVNTVPSSNGKSYGPKLTFTMSNGARFDFTLPVISVHNFPYFHIIPASTNIMQMQDTTTSTIYDIDTTKVFTPGLFAPTHTFVNLFNFRLCSPYTTSSKYAVYYENASSTPASGRILNPLIREWILCGIPSSVTTPQDTSTSIDLDSLSGDRLKVGGMQRYSQELAEAYKQYSTADSLNLYMGGVISGSYQSDNVVWISGGTLSPTGYVDFSNVTFTRNGSGHLSAPYVIPNGTYDFFLIVKTTDYHSSSNTIQAIDLVTLHQFYDRHKTHPIVSSTYFDYGV